MKNLMQKRTIKQDDLLNLKALQGARFSPDGKSIIYCVSWIDRESETETWHLFLIDLQTKSNRQLTSGKHQNYSACWSPDSQSIAFISDRSGISQVYTMKVNSGESLALTQFERGVGDEVVWSLDGKHLAFNAPPQVDPIPSDKPFRVTRNIYRFNGLGYVDRIKKDVYLLNLADNALTKLTNGQLSHSSLRWSPDSSAIACLSTFKPDSYIPYSDINLIKLDGTTTGLLNDFGRVSCISWMPSGERILFSGLPESRPIGTKSELWELAIEEGTLTSRSQSLPYPINGGLQDDLPVNWDNHIAVQSNHAICNVQIGGTVQIYAFALEGKESYHPVIAENQTSHLLDTNNHHLLYAVGNLNDPSELWLSQLDGSSPIQLTSLNQAFLSNVILPEIENFKYHSQDGTEVEGWLMKPPRKFAPYPTILYVHGGPQSAFGFTFSFDFQMLAGAGYAVFFANPRGSTGYGNDFVTAIKKGWGVLDYQDLMAGVDYVIHKGWSDPERLGVCGLSYGGYMSCWMVTQTDRFKAAVPENPVSDLFTEYATNDLDPWLSVDEYGGKPHEAPEVYRMGSPITYAHHCKTPTLLLQGESDYRCPPVQSEQFYTTLKANGCTVEMVRFPGASHAASISGAVAIRLAQNECLLDWMNRYVLNQTIII